ncbi:hypothetical protein Aduo_019403 [Ancylostoma duodenale]
MYLRRGTYLLKTWIRGIASKEEHFAVRAGLHRDPRKTLFVYDDKVVSYGEFLKWTGRYASLLNGKYNISKGDRVLCRTSKTLDSVALYMACLQLGAVYIPVNPSYTRSETDHYVKDSTPKLLVTCDEEKDKIFQDRIANVQHERTLSKQSQNASVVLDIENVDSSDVACVCYTSGTTGLPKGAMLTHGSLSSNAEALIQAWRFTENDKLLHMLPFYHVHGMFISLSCSLFSHSTVIWREGFSVEDCLKWLPSTTVMMGVPTYYSRLLSKPEFTRDILTHMRLFVSGSAPLSNPVWEEFKTRTGHAILERYGMTEAQVICSNPYDDRRPGCVGMPVGDTKLRINKEGGIEIQSSSLFSGYWKNPAKTAQEFTQDKYFITGDIGAIDDDGFLRILGRGKDLVITGGFNVYPKEIEDCIDRLPDVSESAIIGVPHKDLGEVPVAVALTEVLVKYKVPKRVVFLPKLPRNSMAKIQKNVLREQYKHLCDAK